MQLLITGISGQIGTRLAEMLDARGVAYRGLDVVAPRAECPFLACDLVNAGDCPGLEAFLAPVTHVVHLASVMSVAEDIAGQWQEFFDVNVVGLVNLLEALPAGIEHFCFASSMTVYGVPEASPVPETHPLRPDNLYALGKLAAERYLRLHQGLTGLPVANLRYASVYGPGRITHRAVPNMIETVLDGEPPVVNGTGATMRDYVYIDDICEATIAAAGRRAAGDFNIGSGVGTPIRDLAGLILELAGSSQSLVMRPERPDGYSLYYDVARMERELGVVSRTPLRDGLAATIAWHRSLRGAPNQGELGL